MLAALEVDASTPEAAERAVQEHDDAAWRRMLPPSMVIREGWAPTVDVHVRHGEPVSVWIELEARRHPVEPASAGELGAAKRSGRIG